MLNYSDRNSSSESLVFKLGSTDETDAFGQWLAAYLQSGDVIALIGPLGAGKTRLVKAIATALGVPTDIVNSPTFTLIQEYQGCLPIRHCDVYRLKSPREFPELGLDELFAEDGIALIEWADRVVDDLPAERLEIRLEPTGLSERQMTILGHGARGAELIEAIRAQ